MGAVYICMSEKVGLRYGPTASGKTGSLKKCARDDVGHVAYLARLTELELIDRERRMIERKIKSAKFPAIKTLDSFDFKVIPSLNKLQVADLARCGWIERRENVIAFGAVRHG